MAEIEPLEGEALPELPPDAPSIDAIDNDLPLNETIASKTPPDQFAAHLDMSRKSGVPVEVVARNPVAVREKIKLDDAQLKRDQEIVRAWKAKIANNAIIAQGDNSLNGIAKATESSVFREVAQNTVPAFQKLGAGVARIPAWIYATANQKLTKDNFSPWDPLVLVKAYNAVWGDEEKVAQTTQKLLNNHIATYLDEAAEEGMTDYARKDFEWSGRSLLAKTTLQAPSSVAALAATFLFKTPAPGMVLMYGTAGSDAFKNSIDLGASVEKATANAQFQGMVESLGYLIVENPLFKGLASGVIDPLKKMTTKEVIGRTLGRLAVATGKEVTEEEVVGTTQWMSDFIFGVRKWEDFGEAVNELPKLWAETAATTALLTGGMTGPAAVQVGYVERAIQKQREQHKELYQKIVEYKKQSTTNAGDPYSFEDFVKSAVRDTNLSTIIIDTKALESKLESMGIDPLTRMMETGLGKEYNTALDQGSHMVVSTEKWLGMPDEILDGMADYMTFDPNRPTVAEAKVEEKEMQKAEDDARETAKSENIDPLVIKAIEEGLKKKSGKLKVTPKIIREVYNATRMTEILYGEAPGSRLSKQFGVPVDKIQTGGMIDSEVDYVEYNDPEFFNWPEKQYQSAPKGEQRLLDDLTGLRSKRAFKEEAGNYKSLVSIDIDLFKDVNIGLSEQVVDKYFFPIIGKIFKDIAGKNGTVYHTGGDEFFVGTNLSKEDAVEFEKDFRRRVEESRFKFTANRPADKGRPASVVQAFFTGIDISMGTGEGVDEAINSRTENKELRKKQGITQSRRASDDQTKIRPRYFRFRELGPEELLPTSRSEVGKIKHLHSTASRAVAVEPIDSFSFLPKEMANRLRDKIAEANASAVDELTDKIQSESKKKTKQWYKEDYAKEEARARKELESSPIYVAKSGLDSGAVKIQKSSIPSGVVVPAKYIAKDGMPIEEIASNFGFDSGDVMLKEIASAPPLDEAIRLRTENAMAYEYDNMEVNGTLSAEAIASILNTKQDEIYELQQKYMVSKEFATYKKMSTTLGRIVNPGKYFTTKANETLAKTKMSLIDPKFYLQAMKKANFNAQKEFNAGNYEGAFDALEQQRLNSAMYKQALKLKKSVTRDIAKMNKMLRPDSKLSKSRDVDFANAVRAVMSKAGISKVRYEDFTGLDKIQTYQPDLHAVIMDRLDTVPQSDSVNELTYEQFVAAKTVADIFSNMSTEFYKARFGKTKIEHEEAAELMRDALSKLKPEQEYEARMADKTFTEMATDKLLIADAATRRIGSWVNMADNNDVNGVMHKLIYDPVIEAVNVYDPKKRQRINQFGEILKKYDDIVNKNDNIDIPEFSTKWNAGKTLIPFLLHYYGNESNRYKLCVGAGYANAVDGVADYTKVESTLARLREQGYITERHIDMCQEIWDMLDEMKPDIQKAHHEVNGFYMDEITNKPFEMFGKKYKGGYFPVKYDASFSRIAQENKKKLELEENAFGNAWPTTGSGSTKSRNQMYAGPVETDLGMLVSHIDWACRYAYIEPAVQSVARLLKNNKVQETFFNFNPHLMNGMIIPWLKRASKQTVTEVSNSDFMKMIDKASLIARANAAMSIMAMNVSVTLQQGTGLFVALPKVGAKNMVKGLTTYLSDSKAIDQIIREASPEMARRTDTLYDKIDEEINRILGDPNYFVSKYKAARDFQKKHSYFTQVLAQGMVDKIVWWSQYNGSVAKGKDHATAVKESDEAVLLTQGSFAPEQVSSVESGTNTYRLFNMFYNFFNMLSNFYRTEYSLSRQNDSKTGTALRMAYIGFSSFWVVASIADVISRAVGDRWDEDDDGEIDWLQMAFGAPVRMLPMFVPLVGPIASTALNKYMDDNPYNDRISVSPAFSSIEKTINLPGILASDNITEGNKLRSSMDTLGFLSGMPFVSAAGKPLGYITDLALGNDGADNPIEFARKLATGPSRK